MLSDTLTHVAQVGLLAFAVAGMARWALGSGSPRRPGLPASTQWPRSSEASSASRASRLEQKSPLASLVAGDATLDDIDAQRDAIRDAFDATAASADDLEASVSSEADTAFDTYQDAVDAIPGDATASEAAPAYATAARGYLASLSTIAVDAGCETDG